MDAYEHRTKEKIKIRIKKKKPFRLNAKSLILSSLVLLVTVFVSYLSYEILASKPAAEWQEVSAKADSYIQ